MDIKNLSKLTASADATQRMQDTIRKALGPQIQLQSFAQRALADIHRSRLALEEVMRTYPKIPQFAVETRELRWAQEAARFAFEEEKIASILRDQFSEMDRIAQRAVDGYERNLESIRKSMRLSEIIHSQWMVKWQEIGAQHAELLESVKHNADALEVPPILAALGESELEEPSVDGLEVARGSVEEQWKQLPLWVRIGVWFFVFWILQPMFERYFIDWLLNAPDETTREQVVIQINQTLGPSGIESLRCVNASGLRVREEANTSARIKGHLASGQAVEVVEISGAFAFIRYVDAETHQLSEGWAAVSRLKRTAC